mmetsp:Transcript_27226/g.31074  ORF Transcript_27226/g.31074 Transcript_27226/m.31074 type:complete len:203 (+) Transcript_27226:30-638(+)|eukprot:CAMPEP_0194132270 /NCGR_PEP_ID=MMETSP0152-20130528/2776_1 /TAXON_ID=1049557 /ORGANISM="Thalassiothrix antarctica, Strain L6-D1" /LENGTH=202 /DNA_ID=CAMNT_0038827261 /DNA_START=17 /DNA_END=625 /DNA_ORIENTATION=-
MIASKFSKFSRPIAAQACRVAETRTVSTLATCQNAALYAPKDNSPLTFDLKNFATRRNFCVTAESVAKAPAISPSEVKDLFGLWNDALATLDADTVAKRYASTSVLHPTISDVPRTDYDSIKSYFVGFLKTRPQGAIVQSNVIQGDDWCMDAGVYEFTLAVSSEKVLARYSFVYVYEEDEWKIAHHHSSIMPEEFLGHPDWV